jgi:OOP family OmpA-OmpF porin
VIGELEASLPEVFALHAILPKAPDASTEGPPEFTATLSPEGRVQLRGRLSSEIARQTADSYAKARFGSQSVFTAARVAENLPADWPARTLAGLEALSKLANGQITVTPDDVIVIGQTGNQEAGAEIATLLAAKLGDSATFEIDVEYVKRLDASLGIPTPQECEARIVESIGARKLSFEPGSATLDASAKEILDDLAVLLKTCGDIPLEIGGHTDSQGREEMNQRLSQDRAQSVLDALRGRLVPTRNYTVTGYGEMQPVADNDTEEGREANRRIEFKLIDSKIADALAGETAFDETEAPAAEMATEATASEAAAETDDAQAEASGEGAEAETAPADEASESSEDDLGDAPAEAAEATAQNDAQTETEEPLQDPEATEAAAGIGADKAVPEGAVRASDFVPEDSDS